MAQGGIKKIAVVGAESTGKTWLCEALAQHYGTVCVPEYAREYFNNSDIYDYTLSDLVTIARRQTEMEGEMMQQANKFLFCDTTLITLKIWAELEFNTTPAFIQQGLAQVNYDYYFLTDNQVPWVPDPLRQNKHSRDLLFQMNEAEIKKSMIPYTIITGTDDQRLNNAIQVIENQNW